MSRIKFILLLALVGWLVFSLTGIGAKDVHARNNLVGEQAPPLVVGLSDETPEQVRALTSPRIEYSLAVDTQARMKRAVGVTGIPHVLLVDPSGVVRWQGFPFERGHELTPELVEALLNEYVP